MDSSHLPADLARVCVWASNAHGGSSLMGRMDAPVLQLPLTRDAAPQKPACHFALPLSPKRRVRVCCIGVVARREQERAGR